MAQVSSHLSPVDVQARSTRASTAQLSARRATHIQLAPAEGRDQWDRLLSRLEGATPFHSWEWLEWIAPLLHCRFEPLVALDHTDTPVGAVPLLLKRLGPVNTANWVPFPYVGPLVRSEHLGALLDALRAGARHRRVVNLQIVSHPLAHPTHNRVETYLERGFDAHVDETFLIDLRNRDLDEIRAAMSKHARQKLSSFLDRGKIQLRPSTPEEIEHLLPAIEASALERQGLRSSYAPELGRELAQRPPDVPMRITSAVVDGSTVAIVSTLGGQIALGWLGGTLDRSQSGATLCLYWDAIAWAHDIGSDYLDMVGVPNPGIASFKRQFGGTLHPYVVAGRTATPYRLLTAANAAYRRRHGTTQEAPAPSGADAD